ncbi:MAG: pyruvate dehydrogenase (acetyl-transferring) E1 component subunit alpha [Planctomycetota bacterium JB042]
MSLEMLTVLETKKRGKPALPKGVDDDLVRRMYRLMLTTRLMDDRAMKLQRQGRIGFYVPSIGQEACAVGSAAVMTDEDWCFPSYREPGAVLTLGADLQAIVHEWYGNAADNTKGRQMPVHYSFKAQRFVSISSPIGTQIVQGAGAAMAMRIRGRKAFSITYFGDGATSSNDFHTGLNFAAVYKAPCVFFCSNNQWAISCPLSQQTASESIAVKAQAYGMPGVRVDGNDVLAVYQATSEAAERARAGDGPTLIEGLTFRIGPHSSSDDPTRYRPSEQLEEWQAKDPIARLEAFMKKAGLWEEAFGEPLVEEINASIAAAVKVAEETAMPASATLFDDVYADLPAHLAEQRDRLLQQEKTAGAAEMDADAAFPL